MYYNFVGSWYWGCFADSEEEAIKKFKEEAYPEELDIGEYEEITVEEITEDEEE